MCGIIGIVDPSGDVDHLGDKKREHIISSQIHRGPDEQTIFPVTTKVLFFQSRLAIVDPTSITPQPFYETWTDVTGGLQPFRLTVQYNGEIYNHEFLRTHESYEKYEQGWIWFDEDTFNHNYKFKTKSDGEVIIAHLFNLLTNRPITDTNPHKMIGYVNQCVKWVSKNLDGDFAFSACFVFPKLDHLTIVALSRDLMGVCPLYYSFEGKSDEKQDGGGGIDSTRGHLCFASEAKSLVSAIDAMGDFSSPLSSVSTFPPGHYGLYAFSDELISPPSSLTLRPYNELFYQEVTPLSVKDFASEFQPYDLLRKTVFTAEEDAMIMLKEKLQNAVRKRLMTDVPYGVLLSGGLDSSLVASIVCREIVMNGQDPKTIHTFSVGLADSPDLENARVVADFLGTTHHERIFTIEEAHAVLPEVIKHLETYDVTTIRAGTPMYILSKFIAEMGIKMVLSGEGADELLGGYLYFHKAPSEDEFHRETISKLKILHKYDVLRANKATLAHSVECRVPFLDRKFLHYAMRLPASLKMVSDPISLKMVSDPISLKMVSDPVKPANNDVFHSDPRRRIEKFILRKAFDTPEHPYLPDSVLWRQKAQFSDAVGYCWIDSLKQLGETNVSDDDFANRSTLFPFQTPSTKEAFMYRRWFQEYFQSIQIYSTNQGLDDKVSQTVEYVPTSVACSTATAARWDASWKGKEDASGRAVFDVCV